MPVGCLGGGSGNGSHGGGGGGGGPRGQQQQPDLEVIVTSSILNSADQFAFMQQTLLMQIFRITTPTTVSQNLSVISKIWHIIFYNYANLREIPKSGTTYYKNFFFREIDCTFVLFFRAL